MNYNDIIKKIAKKENVSEKEIEKKMNEAIQMSELNCSPKQFIETVADILRNYQHTV